MNSTTLNFSNIFKKYDISQLKENFAINGVFQKIITHYFKEIQFKATTKKISPLEWLKNEENIATAIKNITRNQQQRIESNRPQVFSLSATLEQNIEKYLSLYLSTTSDGHKVSNFNTNNAKKIYMEYSKENDTVLDFSAGYGVRMLSATRLGRHYIGLEPHTELYQKLCECSIDLGLNTSLLNIGSETEQVRNLIGENTVDLAFSSPPYFNLEIYEENNPQQSTFNRTYQQWLEEYVRPTLKNIYYCLKENGICIINIKNLINKNKEPLFDDWLKIAQEIGFYHVETKEIQHKKRPTIIQVNYTQFAEPIMVLEKRK